MNTKWRHALLAAALLFATGQVAAAPVRNPLTLYTFCKDAYASRHRCWGGKWPMELVAGPDGNYYGITAAGGIQTGDGYGGGVVYRLDPVSRTLQVLHQFDRQSEGAGPQPWLRVGPDGNLYGALASGGPGGAGNIFRLTLNGDFTMVHALGPGEGPAYNAIMDNEGNWFGTKYRYEPDGPEFPEIYEISADGIFKILYTFDSPEPMPSGLVLASDGNLYGVTEFGGQFGNGTAFRLSRDGDFTDLHDFTRAEGNPSGDATALPPGPPSIGPDGALYGVLHTYSFPTVGVSMYRIGLDGQVTVQFLADFPPAPFKFDFFGQPLTFMPDGYFYGYIHLGGGTPTLFRFSLSGDFSVLENVPQPIMSPAWNRPRPVPVSSLIRGFDDALYGTNYQGGEHRTGSIFRYLPPPVE